MMNYEVELRIMKFCREYLINDGKTSNSTDPDLLDDSSDTSGSGKGKGGASTGTGTGQSGSGSATKAQPRKSLKLSAPK